MNKASSKTETKAPEESVGNKEREKAHSVLESAFVIELKMLYHISAICITLPIDFLLAIRIYSIN